MRLLDPYKNQIQSYLQMGLNLTSIKTIINHQLSNPITYNSFKYFVQYDETLLPFWHIRKENGASKLSRPLTAINNGI
jgi:hypothetical protein